MMIITIANLCVTVIKPTTLHIPKDWVWVAQSVEQRSLFYYYYLVLRDRAWAGQGQRERETQNPKQAPCCQHGARCGAQTPEPRDPDLNQNQELDAWPTEPQADDHFTGIASTDFQSETVFESHWCKSLLVLTRNRELSRLILPKKEARSNWAFLLIHRM